MATVGRWPNNDTRFDDVRRIVSRRDAHDYGKNRVEGNVCAKLLDGPHARDRHGDATHIPGAIADDAIPITRVPRIMSCVPSRMLTRTGRPRRRALPRIIDGVDEDHLIWTGIAELNDGFLACSPVVGRGRDALSAVKRGRAAGA